MPKLGTPFCRAYAASRLPADCLPVRRSLVPALVEAREVVGSFQAMVRAMTPAKLSLDRARQHEPYRLLARGVAKDEAAVRAAMTLLWSNSQITKLKLVNRQIDGR